MLTTLSTYIDKNKRSKTGNILHKETHTQLKVKTYKHHKKTFKLSYSINKISLKIEIQTLKLFINKNPITSTRKKQNERRMECYKTKSRKGTKRESNRKAENGRKKERKNQEIGTNGRVTLDLFIKIDLSNTNHIKHVQHTTTSKSK